MHQHQPQTPSPFWKLGPYLLNEIHIKQLCFLHHIVSLQDDDPVKTTYLEQLRYTFEPNWGNSITQLKLKYGICETDNEISEMSKERWNRHTVQLSSLVKHH